MMEAAHTPGPWREGQEGNARVYGPDGMGEHSGLIAVVYKGRANVHLIAAAPDLFDALRALLDIHIAHHNHPAHVAARAAIAKAEGAP